MHPGPDHQPDRRRRLRDPRCICSMSLLIVGLDATIVNVALPSIHRSLHSSLSGLQWTIDAYTLVLASLLLLSGSTADRIGRRRVFQIGLSLFSLGSLLCALAPSLGLLIGARVLQAIGGSMLNPVAMSIIRNVFEDPRERARAIGVWGAVFGISMALGPVIGGALVDSVGWRSIFVVNVPVGLLAIALTALYVPESRAARPRRLDLVGQLLVIVGLATLTYAIIEAPGNGWLSAQTVTLFADRAGRVRGAGALRAPPRRAADRGPLLRQRPVRGRQRDRGLRVRRAGRLSVSQHALSTGGARPVAARCRAVRAPARARDGRDRADLGPDGQHPRRRGCRWSAAGSD